MNAFWLALQFLTRLPTPAGPDHRAEALGRSVLLYPMVGLLIGGLLWLIAHALEAHPVLGPALVTASWAAVTGGLHLDGLADCADAWIGGHGDRARTLAIMKDPRAGPAAVVALVSLLLVKYAALAELWRDGDMLPLLLAPMLARTAIPALLVSTDYVRPGGLGSALAKHLPKRAAEAVIVAVLMLGVPWLGWSVTMTAIITVWGLRRAMNERLGGCTGDTLGATVELVEAAILTAAVLA